MHPPDVRHRRGVHCGAAHIFVCWLSVDMVVRSGSRHLAARNRDRKAVVYVAKFLVRFSADFTVAFAFTLST
jgi:hypothetical protein